MFNLEQITRPNVKHMQPYSSARDEFSGTANIWLDANENPYPGGYNRYPDPRQQEVKQLLSNVKGVPTENIFLGNGSDEAIDLLFRAFCVPGQDKVLLFTPTYGMYKVSAALNDVKIIELPLTADFQLDVPQAKAICEAEKPKMMFICSPNNPTGNLIPKGQILALAENFPGIVVVDEAYIDFSPAGSLLPHLPTAYPPLHTANSPLPTFPNLVVLQTFSKAWGLAGIRLGMAFAGKEIIAIFNKIKPPYNINQLTQEVAIAKLQAADEVSEKVAAILAEKEKLSLALAKLENVENIFPSDANFVLVQFKNPQFVFQKMQQKGIILRDRRSAVADCLRITIGTPAENETLLQELYQLENRTYAIEPKPAERTARIHRKTSETDILIELNLDRRDQSTFSTGLGFFDHMLEQISKHGNVGLKVQVKGDLHIDEHHTIEDTALALGQAFLEALGSKKGIQRYGFLLPMDDVLAQVALDFGGRPWIVWDADFNREKIGEMPTEMFYHFFKSFSDTAKCNLNIKAEGQNEHHKIEAIFKAFAKAVRMAIAKTGDDSIPSTKGIL